MPDLNGLLGVRLGYCGGPAVVNNEVNVVKDVPVLKEVSLRGSFPRKLRSEP